MALFDFHLMKFEGAIVFQVLDQEIYEPTFLWDEHSVYHGWHISSDQNNYPSINLSNKTIYLRNMGSITYEELYHISVTTIPEDMDIDETYKNILYALEAWALKARNINEV